MPRSYQLRLRQAALALSGAFGFFVPATFAWTVYRDHLAQNLATWIMFLALDSLGLVLAYQAGNRRPVLQAGWCLAAALVLAAILSNGASWRWGWVENVSLACCAAAVAAWQWRGAAWGLWPYMAAAYFSFVPQAVDFWYRPQPETLWLWAWTIVGCAFAVLGAEKRDFASVFVPLGCIVPNLIACILVLR